VLGVQITTDVSCSALKLAGFSDVPQAMNQATVKTVNRKSW